MLYTFQFLSKIGSTPECLFNGFTGVRLSKTLGSVLLGGGVNWGVKIFNISSTSKRLQVSILGSIFNCTTSHGVLHHQQLVLVIYHVQLCLIIELRLNVHVIFLSKDFCDERRRVKALTCGWHHERARVIAADPLVLLMEGGERVMMVAQIDG